LSASYPLLIHEILNRLEEHTYTEAEATAYRQALAARERERLITLRDEALASRDTIFLTGKAPQGAAGEARVKELNERIEKLDALAVDGIEVSRKKTVELAAGGESPLLPEVIGPPAAYAAAKNLDLLVFGVIEEIESYLFVDVRLYSDAYRELPVLKTAFSRERLFEGSAAVFDSLVRTVLGREWAEITVAASVESAEIYFDGGFKGVGEVALAYIEPGEHTVAVKAFGYQDFAEKIYVGAGEAPLVAAQLIEAARSPVTISSIPPGAEFYARSRWYGATPVEVPADFVHAQGVMSKEGYQDALVPDIPRNGDSLEIRLLTEKFDRRTMIKNEREGFYKVLGAFILSLPLPVYFFDRTNTLTQSYMTEAQRPPFSRNLDEAYRLLELRQISLGAYIETTFLSVALFVDATIELLEYIDRVQLTTY